MGNRKLGFGLDSVLEKYYTFHIFPCWFTKYINIFLSVYIFDPSHLKHFLKLFHVRSTDDTFDRKKVHSGKVFQWSLRLKTPLVMLLLHHLLVAVTQGKIMVDTLEGCIYPPWYQVKTEGSSSSYHMKSIYNWLIFFELNENLSWKLIQILQSIKLEVLALTLVTPQIIRSAKKLLKIKSFFLQLSSRLLRKYPNPQVLKYRKRYKIV